MADELHTPNHRWYEPRNHIALAKEDVSKQWIYDSGIQKIDAWIASQPWGDVFSPSSLFSSGEEGVWYDPSDLTTMWTDTAGTTQATAVLEGDTPTAANAVARIDDKSGNGNHATQITAPSRPYLTVTAGGLYYLSFDGANDVLSRASFAFTEELSFFGAYSDQCSMSQSDLSTTNNYIWSGIGGAGALSNIRDSGANDILTEAVSGNGVIGSIFEGVATGGAYALRVNGTETDTGTATATPSGIDTFSIGALLRDGSAYLAGGFYGGVVLDRLLTTDEITNTEAYLATRSGVSI